MPARPWGRSSAGRASQWHCEGQGFDPPRLHHSPLSPLIAAARCADGGFRPTDISPLSPLSPLWLRSAFDPFLPLGQRAVGHWSRSCYASRMSEAVGIILVVFAACWTAAAAFIWLLVRSLSRGVWYWHTLKVNRDDQPLTFWVGPAGYAAMSALLLWFPINVTSWFH